MKHILLILSGIVVAAVFSLLLFLHYFMNGERFAGYVNGLSGNPFYVEIEKVSLNLFRRTLLLNGVKIHPGEAAGSRLLFAADTISIETLRLADALRGDVAAGKLVVTNFELHPDHLPGQAAEEKGKENLRSVVLDSVRLNQGEVRFTAGDEGKGLLRGVQAEGANLRYRFGCDDCNKTGIAGDIRMKIADAEYTFGGGRYQWSGSSIRMNQPDSLLQAEKMVLKPTMDEEDFFASLEYRTEMFETEVVGLELKGLDMNEFLKQKQLDAVRISLDSLALHVTLDKRIPPDPGRGVQPMPLEALNELPFQTAVDSIRISRADIRYSEYDEEGVRPGTIYFANTRISAGPVYSNSDTPVVLTAQSILENNGELNTEMRFWLEEDVHMGEIKGDLGRFDPALLNKIFMDLEGIRITSGIVYRLNFEYLMHGPESDGYVMIYYDDLSLEFVDRIDHERSLGDRIKGFVTDRIVIRESSGNDGEESRRGDISGKKEPENGFFHYLWTSLRSGILDAVKRF